MDLKQEIGIAIQKNRELNGFTRNDFLNYINISLNSLASIENGKSLVKIDTLVEITNALGISLSEFFESINR